MKKIYTAKILTTYSSIFNTAVQEAYLGEKLIQPVRGVVNLRNNWKSSFEKNKFRLFKTIRLFVLDVYDLIMRSVFGIINYGVISPQVNY